LYPRQFHHGRSDVKQLPLNFLGPRQKITWKGYLAENWLYLRRSFATMPPQNLFRNGS
jgi:hypothetical protein